MSGLHLVQFEEVYSQVATLRSTLAGELYDADARYEMIRSALIDQVDSASNATLLATVEQNRLKAHAYVQILDQLLVAIDNAARKVQSGDKQMASTFAAGGGK